uniref:NADH-ubiquinone oxidoreductase chain 4 n=1 Tax=Rhysodes sp. BMNH-844233 TaxID=1909167 RepID=A0A343A4C6_9CARA|nr:NADH dehydrogenase subunit 4 [Rhysodes sp. BMNH-844233]
MLKFIFMIIFLIPLSFMGDLFWMNQLFYFLFSFVFMISGMFMLYFVNFSYFFGADLLSFGMILLSLWICGLMVMASSLIYKNKFYLNLFLFVLLMLLLMLVLTFCSVNLFMFYFFFEGSLIPMLILIMGWGYQPERLQAGMYLFFYTLLASLPMMVGIFWFYNEGISLDFYLIKSFSSSVYLFLCMVMAFLVKLPMFLVHLWLPKAHVEAPVSGSMVLAGVMLKLGGYGLVRVSPVFVSVGLSFSEIFISIGLVGGVLISLICLRQVDLKSLIAYSSISHMGLMMAGLMTFNLWGYYGSFALMLAHGLCSSGLFCLANIIYERVGSRSFFLGSGMLNLMPSMTIWWFLFCVFNMAAPPSLNLIGEINLINSLMSWSWLSMLSLIFLSFFSAVYSLFLYSYSQHGIIYSGLYSNFSGFIREYLLLFLHWVPLSFLFMKGSLIIWI